jgi:hypothetical protein
VDSPHAIPPENTLTKDGVLSGELTANGPDGGNLGKNTQPTPAPTEAGKVQTVDFDFSDLGEVESFTIKKSGTPD